MTGMDRRAARTRRALGTALVELILERGYEGITVQDILDAADVGRSTFYAHFTGKDDLLRSGFSDLRRELAARQAATAGPPEPPALMTCSLGVFEHACANRRVYRAMLGGRGGTVIAEEMRLVLTELVRREPVVSAADGVPRDLMVAFVVGVFETVLMWCLERPRKLAPAEIDRLFTRLVAAGLGVAVPDPAGASVPAAEAKATFRQPAG